MYRSLQFQIPRCEEDVKIFFNLLFILKFPYMKAYWIYLLKMK